MKFFLDTEFIENGVTIDLISIGIASEDGRTLYCQNSQCEFKNASDWVARNVFPHLSHFRMNQGGGRSCNEQPMTSCDSKFTGACYAADCQWRRRVEIRDYVLEFCSVEKYGKPEFWGYFADYDWVAFCQLFGSMIHLPKGYPMYCRDLKQMADELGDVKIPKPAFEVHHALSDALWNKEAYGYLMTVKKNSEL